MLKFSRQVHVCEVVSGILGFLAYTNWELAVRGEYIEMETFACPAMCLDGAY